MTIVSIVNVESIEPTKVAVNSVKSVNVSISNRINPIIISIVEPNAAPSISVIRPTHNVVVSASNIENNIAVKISESLSRVRVVVSGSGPVGPTGTAEETFESVSKNLKNYSAALNYTGENLTSIVYNTGSGTITKTFNYTGENLTSIVLSGATPDGISLTKTFIYTGENLTSITYN